MQASNGSVASTERIEKRPTSSRTGKSRNKPSGSIAGPLAALSFIGLTIGCLMGLSVTPVMPTVVGSLLTLAVFTISLLFGVRAVTEQKTDISN
jgi:hypothetical protein